MERGKTRHTFISCVLCLNPCPYFFLHDASLYFTTKCLQKHWFSFLPFICQKVAVCAMAQLRPLRAPQLLVSSGQAELLLLLILKKTPSVVVLTSPEMGLTKTFGECRGVGAHLL